MRFFTLILFLLPAFYLHSQSTVVDVGKTDSRVTAASFYHVSGIPISNTKYVKVVAGSPFYQEAWMDGRLVLPNGTIYDSMRLKLDLLDNSVSYIGYNGEGMTATSVIKNVVLIDSATRKEYSFMNSAFMSAPSNFDKGWYQLLVSGNVVLYKRIGKLVSESRPYGASTVEQTISTTQKYIVAKGSVFTPVKKFKELPEALADKKDELNGYISSKKLSGKSESDFIELITYYNSLLQKPQ